MEPLSTGALITLCIITGAKLTISIVTRIKKSKCVDSKGREMEVNFGDASSETSETPTRHRKKRHSHKRHSHKKKRSDSCD